MSRRLLIVGECDASLRTLGTIDPELSCVIRSWADQGSRTPQAWAPNLVVAVITQCDGSAADRVLRAIASWAAPTIAILPEHTTPEILSLVAPVVDDFLVAPVRIAELHQRVVRLLGSAPPACSDAADPADAVKQTLAREMATIGMIGRDPAFLRTLARIPLAARSAGPVLIIGETGTGKELCARAIHTLSPRAGRPFIPADCTTLPDYLFENEMFGHVSGAYTDARRDQKGLVALADGGTLFLDEINSLSLVAQAKLLRFLESKTYRPLGSGNFAKANLMVVAASNCDLQALVARNVFRADLFFRLNVIRLQMVPLRDRPNDIAMLAQHLIARFSVEAGLPCKPLAPAALRGLMDHAWPGNVRELGNMLQRALLFSKGAAIVPDDLIDAPEPPAAPPPASAAPASLSFRAARSHAVASFERRYVEDLMRECGGNVSQAARLAEKDRRAFGRLVKRYDVPRQFC